MSLDTSVSKVQSTSKAVLFSQVRLLYDRTSTNIITMRVMCRIRNGAFNRHKYSGRSIWKGLVVGGGGGGLRSCLWVCMRGGGISCR